MSKIEVDKVDPQSGTALEIGTSGDTVTVPSGVGLTLTDSTLLLPTTVTATTEVKTNKISPATGVAFALGDSGDTFTVPSGATIVNSGTATGFGGGKVLQVTQGVYQAGETVSSNSDTFGAFSLSGTITPSATSSKVLITASLQLSQSSNYRSFCKMMFDVGGGGYNDLPADSLPTSPGSRVPCHFYFNFPASHNGSGANVGFSYLHDPSTTSALTYKWYACTESTGGSVYMNRSETDTDNNSYGRSASRIILTELDYS